MEENYEVLIDSIRGLVWEGKASQGSWQFTYVSKQAEHFLGYPRQRWLMDRDFWTHRLRPEDRDRTVAARKRALLKKEDHILEYRLTNAERKTIWVQDSVTVKDQGGQLQLQGLLINITELKEAQAVLRQSYSELERLVEQRTASLARINAELKDEIVHRKHLEQELLELT